MKDYETKLDVHRVHDMSYRNKKKVILDVSKYSLAEYESWVVVTCWSLPMSAWT